VKRLEILRPTLLPVAWDCNEPLALTVGPVEAGGSKCLAMNELIAQLSNKRAWQRIGLYITKLFIRSEQFFDSRQLRASTACAHLRLLASPPTRRHSYANNRVVLSYRVKLAIGHLSRPALPAKGETIFIGGNHTMRARHEKGGLSV
jgi:hypothetical protein